MVCVCEQIYVQDSDAEPELKLPTYSCLPIIDPRVSPDGSMLAYVRDDELHVFNFLDNMSKELTSGANGDSLVCVPFHFILLLCLASILSSIFCPYK